MRRCPSCGNLTTSFSCSHCTGHPMTRELEERKEEEQDLYELNDLLNEED